MGGITFGVFTLGIVLLFGAVYNVLSIKKPGFYPPRNILKRRAMLFASCGTISILIGLILTLF